MQNLMAIRKVGILKDTVTGKEDSFILVVRTRYQGTLKFSFTYTDFINGWFQERTKGDGQPMHKDNSVYRLEQGAMERLRLGPYGDEAILHFEVTPTILTRLCGHRRKNTIEWVKPRGKRGGRRMPLWMRSKAKTSEPKCDGKSASKAPASRP